MSTQGLYLVFAGLLLVGGLYAAYLRNFPVMAVLFVLMGLLFAVGMRGRGNWLR
jgi:hypothetical protein